MRGILRANKCQRVACFAKTSLVVGARSFSWEDVKDAWTTLLIKVGWPKERVFEYALLDDDGSSEKVHARYLLSVKGGIRLEHGFQVQPRNARVDVCPLNATIHRAALMQFKDGNHDWKCDFAFRSPS